MRRSINIGAKTERLWVKNRQLNVSTEDGEVYRAPCEDLGVLIADHNPSLEINAGALTRLTQAGVSIVLCDDTHLPSAAVVPLNAVNGIGDIVRDQVNQSQPRRKRAWQQLVQAKVLAQASNVSPTSPARKRIEKLATQVRSGDPENIEAQSARVYWRALFGEQFRRRARVGGDINSLLDYTYAVVRATLARSVMSVGLHPALSFHHSSRVNSLCLIDDLIEPLRPIADRHIVSLADQHMSLTPKGKRLCVEILSRPLIHGQETTDLAGACDRLARETRAYIRKESDRISCPIAGFDVD